MTWLQPGKGEPGSCVHHPLFLTYTPSPSLLPLLCSGSGARRTTYTAGSGGHRRARKERPAGASANTPTDDSLADDDDDM